MKRKPISRLNRKQLGRLFATITDKDDSAFDGSDDQAIRQIESKEQSGRSDGTPGSDNLPCSGTPLLEQPGTWIGRYKLLNILGEGGMGVVYLAEQEQPMKRQVALKVVKPGMDSKRVIARFESERQALALLNHPSIAHVYDAGTTEGGRPYFVMELVTGVSITDYCDQHKLTIEERLELFLLACDSVQHAHQKGIIHRDIKPSNILISPGDDNAVPKIIDFGIAKALTDPLTERTLCTEQGELVGTPEYMSPEQAKMTSEAVDTRTDIYSLGVVLYKLLTGVLPFDAKTLREGGIEHIRRVIREEEPKTPSTRLRTVTGEESTKLAQLRRIDVRTLRQKLHGDLDWITLKAMEKDPNRRYPTAHALAEDIRRHLNHEPVTAGSPTIIYRLRKFVRRNRTQVIAGACVVVVVLMGLLSVKLYKQNMAGKRKLAEEKRNLAFQKAETILSSAEAYYGEGQYEQALEQTALLLELVPDQLNGRLLAARILTDMGRKEEAFQILERLEAEHPEEGAVYELLAMLYVELGNEAIATRYRTLAEKYPPKTAEAFIVRARMAETLDDMVGMLSEALNLDRQHYASRKARALTYFALGDYENMERDADKMTFVQPENPSGYALRAVALRQMGRYSEAIENHNRAIELAGDTYPDITELYDQRRKTYFRMGNYEQALADAKECVERRPDAGNYKCGLLVALIALGRYSEADAESATPPGVLMYNFVPRLAKYVADCLESRREIPLPDRTESGPTVRLMRWIHRDYEQLYSKARRLVPNGAAADYSPDGQKLIYARFNPEKIWQHETPLSHPLKPGSKGIDIIKDLEQGTIRSLVSFGHFPRWSPDGKYIAFVKSPFSFRSAFEHIYIVPAAGGKPWNLGKGVLLGWSRDSKHVYYHRYLEDWFIYKKAFDDPQAEPERIIYSPSYFPAISPDEKYIAYEHRGEVLITDVETRETVATWRLPILPVYYEAAWRRPMPTDYEPIPIEWSPTGRELSIGSELTAFGFWIYNLDTGTASRVFPGAVIWGRWSREGTKMLLVLGSPMWEIWETDINPNRPTVESLGPGMAKQEHCRDMIAEMEDWLVDWPKGTRATLSGRIAAFCHAGLGHEDEAVKGLDKWLRSLSTWPETQPPTYWQMANCVLDCYDPGTDDGNAALSLAAKVAELAQDSWAGEVLAGMAHYRAGAYEDAMAHLEHAEQLRGQSGADLYPDQVAYTAMTLNRLGRRQEAEDALERLRAMFLHNTSHDDFQPLVKAEKVFTEENRLLPTVWDHIELGYLDKALELLIAARESVKPSDSEVDADTMSAQRQLALRFAARGQGYEQRSEYGRAANEFESAAAATPWHAEMLNLLALFQATCSEAKFRDGAKAVENATKACGLSNWDNYNYIDTLAAACAQAGQFEQAVKWQSQAITKLPADVRPGSRAQYEAKLQLYQQGQAYHGQYLLTGKLIAWYSFDDISGNTVPDSSGNKIDATLFGDARIVDDPVRGKVLELDGDGDWVDCGNDSLFGITEEITISSWIKVNGPAGLWRTIISKGNGWKLQSWPNTLKFVCGVNVPGDIGVDSGIRGKKNINDGRWHHVTGVYDGRTATLYIDGQRDVSAAVAGSITANSYNVWIGSDSHRNERAWKGRIDDVRIYSYALTAAEVKGLYEGSEPPRDKH
ncbi:MAG TPA: LamG-like jellyroll fold domain-containing protein [Sedimentisphaerales bacterium]|nr:LamG-like jellyroll fold domain-containing protein [Sedimentisphaerales bacterium]